MAELKSSRSAQPKSKISFEVTMDNDEFEIKYKDIPTRAHISRWNCEVVPATLDLGIHRDMDIIRRFPKAFDDCLNVTLTSVRNRKKCLIFAFGHDTFADAVQMVNRFVEVKQTILKFIREIYAKVKDISLKCWVGEQNGSSEEEFKNTGKTSKELFLAPGKSDGYKSETDWFCKLSKDEFEMDLTSSQTTFTRLKHILEHKYHCILKRVRRGSLIFECKHESREDAVKMMKDHEKVKDTILECLQDMDPRVNAIRVDVEYRENHIEIAPGTDTGSEPGSRDTPQGSDQPSGASSHTREMEALRPGATQESELHATSREEETRKSGTPQGPGTRATPTPARTDPRADSDLLVASREGNMAAVKRILAAGRADVNCRGGGGRTPVMTAALGGHRDVVELLVSEGADVSLVNEDGNNILHYACWGGNVETVKFVLSLHVVDINSRGWRSRTPVMAAAVGGHRDVVELLVKEGADVSLVDEDGDNILHLACWGGDVETVKYVLSLHVVDINSRGEKSWTPVMRAAWRGHRDVVELLVSKGANVSLVNEDGDNILHLACWGGDVETVKCVLSLHVVDINSRGWRSRTPVMTAALRGHRDVVELLVSEGADVSLVNEVGNNILHYACWGGNVETVKCVLSLNVVDIDARNNAGLTAADCARHGGHQEVVKLLKPPRCHVM